MDTQKGLLNQRPIYKYDILLVSIPFEPDFEKFLIFLKKSGIEPLREKRRSPLIIAGGPAVILNPLPLYPFVDILLIGEAEAIFTKELCKELLESPVEEIREIFRSKIYALLPHEKETAIRVYLKDLNYSQASSIIAYKNSVFDMFLIEIQRGCAQKCRFCLLGNAYLPPRYMPFKRITELLNEGKEAFNSIGFVGSSVFSHPDIEEILKVVSQNFDHIGFSSIGVNDIISKPWILKMVKSRGVRSLTIAPETDERLRKAINKPYTDQDILKAVEMISEEGFEGLKLYFMIGLPSERPEDISEIVELVKKIRSIFKKRINITISIFIPKFHTPLQSLPFASSSEIRNKLKILKAGLKNLKNLKVHYPSYSHARVEALSARGDEQWGYYLYMKIFKGKALKIDRDKYLFDREYLHFRISTHPVNTGVGAFYLKREFERYKQFKRTPACMVGICRLCGLCKTGLENPSRKA